jgi:hypothetical protein
MTAHDAKGVIVRRPRMVALAEWLDLDRRAIRRLQRLRRAGTARSRAADAGDAQSLQPSVYMDRLSKVRAGTTGSGSWRLYPQDIVTAAREEGLERVPVVESNGSVSVVRKNSE